jgi:hypothetical protein
VKERVPRILATVFMDILDKNYQNVMEKFNEFSNGWEYASLKEDDKLKVLKDAALEKYNKAHNLLWNMIRDELSCKNDKEEEKKRKISNDQNFSNDGQSRNNFRNNSNINNDNNKDKNFVQTLVLKQKNFPKENEIFGFEDLQNEQMNNNNSTNNSVSSLNTVFNSFVAANEASLQ